MKRGTKLSKLSVLGRKLFPIGREILAATEVLEELRKEMQGKRFNISDTARFHVQGKSLECEHHLLTAMQSVAKLGGIKRQKKLV